MPRSSPLKYWVKTFSLKRTQVLAQINSEFITNRQDTRTPHASLYRNR